MNTPTTHYPIIVATPNDALKYSEARQRIEQSKQSNKLKKKKTFEKIRLLLGKIVKKKNNEKIVVDEQYCFSIIDDANDTNTNYSTSNYFYNESSTEDAFSEFTSSNYFSKITPPSPSLNQEVVPYHNLNKKQSKFNFVKKLKAKKAARKAKKRYRENLQNTTLPLNNNNNDLINPISFASPKMKDILNENQTATASPLLNNKTLAPSINSSVMDTASVPFSPSLLNSPYRLNYMKQANTGLRYLSSKKDISVNTTKEYASSIYSDDSYHLPDDEDNIIDESGNDTSSMEVNFNNKEKDNKTKEEEEEGEEEKKFKNPRYNGHFEDSDDESKSKQQPLPIPMQRPFSSMKKVWDNPFGRISFIEYTIEKQKEKEKNKKNKNFNQYNIVTKPPLKNMASKNGTQMIVNKRSISSLSASLNKARKEEVYNAAVRAREKSSQQLNKLAGQNEKAYSPKKESVTNENYDIPPKPQLLPEKESKKAENETSNRDSVVYNDKRGSVISVTNLIKYSDFYDDSNDNSFSSINAGNQYSQAINHYNMYKNKSNNDQTESSTVTPSVGESKIGDNDSKIVDFNVLDELNGDNKESKLSVKKSNNELSSKTDKPNVNITESAKESEETTENDKDNESSSNNEIEYNRYLPSIPSANYLLNNPQLTRSRVINIQDNNFNVLKHANTLKANRRSIIEAELKAKKEEEEREKQRIEAKKEKEKLKEEAKKEKERLKQAQSENNEAVTVEENEEEEVSEEEPDVPRKPEDHYREYYEKEANKRPEEESIDALLESKDKIKGKSINDLVTKVFSKGGSTSTTEQTTEDDDKTKNSNDEKVLPLCESPENEAASVKSKSSSKDTKNKDENNDTNNSTISNRLLNFFKAPSKYLYNEDKEGDKDKEKEVLKEEDKEKEVDKNEKNEKDEKDKKDEKDDNVKVKEDDKSSHIGSPLGSPMRPPYIQSLNGSTKLVRSASLSLAKRHNRQIKESQYKKNLDRNNSTRTNDSGTHSSHICEIEYEDCTIVKSKSTTEDSGNKIVTFAEDDYENEDADRTIILEKKEKISEPDKTPTLTYKPDLNEDDSEKPILSENGIVVTEPETEFNMSNDNIANKIHNLQNDIIVEEDEDQPEEDILVKIQVEMKKKFEKDYDEPNHHEISDTFSIASCSTFSSAI